MSPTPSTDKPQRPVLGGALDANAAADGAVKAEKQAAQPSESEKPAHAHAASGASASADASANANAT